MNILIRDDFPEDLAERLKSHYAEKTASKAVLAACAQHFALIAEISHLKRQLSEAVQRAEKSESLLLSAKQSAIQLLQAVGHDCESQELISKESTVCARPAQSSPRNDDSPQEMIRRIEAAREESRRQKAIFNARYEQALAAGR